MKELRFRAPGWRPFEPALVALTVGGACAVLAPVGFFFTLAHVLPPSACDDRFCGMALLLVVMGLVGAGGLVFLTGAVLCAVGEASIWFRWRQAVAPGASIGADGVRYLLRRGPALVPWSDIEQVVVERRRWRDAVSVYLWVKPSAASLQEQRIRVRDGVRLSVGSTDRLMVSADSLRNYRADTSGALRFEPSAPGFSGLEGFLLKVGLWLCVVSLASTVFGGLVFSPLGYLMMFCATGALPLLLVLVLRLARMVPAGWTWRQWRAPAVVIGEDRVRILLRRDPPVAPWTDIERLSVRRRPGQPVGAVSLCLRPGAAVLRERRVRVSSGRTLKIGSTARMSVAPADAVQFLEHVSGNRVLAAGAVRPGSE